MSVLTFGHFQVNWPLNIVITDTCMMKYGEIFSFMLQLKWAVWVLKDVWHRLKRDGNYVQNVSGNFKCSEKLNTSPIYGLHAL